MKILGVVGGIASGKSTVSSLLGKLGATLLDADQAAHAVLQQEEVKQRLTSRWGHAILDSEGNVDRKKVSQIIFSPSQETSTPIQVEQERHFLEQILHPRIRQQFEQQINLLERQGVAVVVLDAPLLLEAGWRATCDEILFVSCPVQIRLQRALERGWTKQQFTEREQAQWPIEKKQGASTRLFDNSEQTTGQLEQELRSLWESEWSSG